MLNSIDLAALLDQLSEAVHCIPSEDVPGIELYMDQVTTFMESRLNKTKRYKEDKILTKTMINNYAKNRLLPPPNKKKYSKEHLLLMIFIYSFKGFLSLSDIQSVLSPLNTVFFNKADGVNVEDLYNEVCRLEETEYSELKADILRQYEKAIHSFSDERFSDTDSALLQNFALLCMLSYDVYVKKMMIETLIDQINHKDKK